MPTRVVARDGLETALDALRSSVDGTRSREDPRLAVGRLEALRNVL